MGKRRSISFVIMTASLDPFLIESQTRAASRCSSRLIRHHAPMRSVNAFWEVYDENVSITFSSFRKSSWIVSFMPMSSTSIENPGRENLLIMWANQPITATLPHHDPLIDQLTAQEGVGNSTNAPASLPYTPARTHRSSHQAQSSPQRGRGSEREEYRTSHRPARQHGHAHPLRLENPFRRDE
jgi:hypothetical protein